MKPANLRRAPPAEQERRNSAFELSCEATGILSNLRSKDGEAKAAEPLQRVMDLLSQAEALLKDITAERYQFAYIDATAQPGKIWHRGWEEVGL